MVAFSRLLPPFILEYPWGEQELDYCHCRVVAVMMMPEGYVAAKPLLKLSSQRATLS